MASTQTTKEKNTAPVQDMGASEFMDAPPEDMERVGLPSVDGWYDAESKAPVYGKLLGEFRVKNKRGDGYRWVAIIGLLSPTMAKDSENTKAKVKLERGKVVGLGIRAKLMDLLKYRSGAVVWVKPLSKKDIGGGNTMWEFDLRVKGSRKTPDELQQMTAQPLAMTPESEGGDGGDFDDIPF